MLVTRHLHNYRSLFLKCPSTFLDCKVSSLRTFICKPLLAAPKTYSSQLKNMSSKSTENIIWIDLELTGLDPETCHIIEAACIVTDKKMNVVAEGPDLVIHQPLEVLNSMDDWCLEHHKDSGLFKECLESSVSLKQAENALLKFVETHTVRGKSPLAGNTVYMDKLFLLKYMPTFCEHLHYRILDVSSVKLLAKSWYNLDPPEKMMRHRALDDIKESILELKYYQQTILKPAGEVTVKGGGSHNLHDRQ